VPVPPCIDGVNSFRNNSSNRGRPHEKAVLVDMEAGFIAIVMDAELGCVPGFNEVLDINVSNEHILIASLESIELAVRILLHHVEICSVVLDTIRFQISENTNPWLAIEENEAAEITVECLGSDTH